MLCNGLKVDISHFVPLVCVFKACLIIDLRRHIFSGVQVLYGSRVAPTTPSPVFTSSTSSVPGVAVDDRSLADHLKIKKSHTFYVRDVRDCNPQKYCVPK